MTTPNSPKLCRKCGNPEFIGGHGEWKQAIHKSIYGHVFETTPKLEPTKCPKCGNKKFDAMDCHECGYRTPVAPNEPDVCPKCGREEGCQNHFDAGYAAGAQRVQQLEAELEDTLIAYGKLIAEKVTLEAEVERWKGAAQIALEGLSVLSEAKYCINDERIKLKGEEAFKVYEAVTAALSPAKTEEGGKG